MVKKCYGLSAVLVLALFASPSYSQTIRCRIDCPWNDIVKRCTCKDQVGVGNLLLGYRSIYLALSKDKLDLAKSGASDLEALSSRWLSSHSITHSQYSNVALVREGAREMISETVEEEIRKAFGKLSEGMVKFLHFEWKHPPYPHLYVAWQLYLCPKTATYPYWSQPPGEGMQNPYMGLSSPDCGIPKSWAELP